MTRGNSFHCGPCDGNGVPLNQGRRRSPKLENTEEFRGQKTCTGYGTNAFFRGSPELLKRNPIPNQPFSEQTFHSTNIRKGQPGGSGSGTRSPQRRNRRQSSRTPPNHLPQPLSASPVSSLSTAGQSRTPPNSPSTSYFAGSKFGEAPSPVNLPSPPRHWISPGGCSMEVKSPAFGDDHCHGLTSGLKFLLRVQ